MKTDEIKSIINTIHTKEVFTVGVFGMIFDSEERVLFAHRRDYDLWNLPGGGLDAGESIEDCLLREVKEETGLIVKVKSLASVYTKSQANDIVFTFVCEVIGGELSHTDEADELIYFGLNNIPKNSVHHQVERIHSYIENKERVEMGMHLTGGIKDILQKESKKSTRKPLENCAFIDGQNLHKGVSKLDWKLDYYRFRHYLRSKFGVRDAYIFLGYIEENKKLYAFLEKAGFTLVFKQVVQSKNDAPKGNVDVDLTLHVMKHVKSFAKAILITSDGDFAPLVEELKRQDKFLSVLAPTKKKCSHLLKKSVGGNIIYLNEITKKISQVKRRPADR